MSQVLKRPKEKVFEYPQPPHPFFPSHRSGAMVAPSGGGKSSTAISLLMGPYRNCYSRVWVFSPSCKPGLDSLWDAWRKHVRDVMGVPDEEQTMWDTWEPEVIEKLIRKHARVNAHLKKAGKKRGFVGLFLIDDWSDNPKILHSSSNVIMNLFTKGRHSGCACWLLTQKLRSISTLARVNFCFLLVWRLRSRIELDQLLEELDALVDRKILMGMYLEATREPHSFWYINMLQPTDQMFYKQFHQKFALVNKEDDAPISRSTGKTPRLPIADDALGPQGAP